MQVIRARQLVLDYVDFENISSMMRRGQGGAVFIAHLSSDNRDHEEVTTFRNVRFINCSAVSDAGALVVGYIKNWTISQYTRSIAKRNRIVMRNVSILCFKSTNSRFAGRREGEICRSLWRAFNTISTLLGRIFVKWLTVKKEDVNLLVISMGFSNCYKI